MKPALVKPKTLKFRLIPYAKSQQRLFWYFALKTAMPYAHTLQSLSYLCATSFYRPLKVSSCGSWCYLSLAPLFSKSNIIFLLLWFQGQKPRDLLGMYFTRKELSLDLLRLRNLPLSFDPVDIFKRNLSLKCVLVMLNPFLKSCQSRKWMKNWRVALMHH